MSKIVHVLYRSLKLPSHVSTHLKCISKQNIHIHDYKTCLPGVLNIYGRHFCDKVSRILISYQQIKPPEPVNKISKTVVGSAVQKSAVLIIFGV